MHLVGFITKKTVTMYGHMNVKFTRELFVIKAVFGKGSRKKSGDDYFFSMFQK